MAIYEQPACLVDVVASRRSANEGCLELGKYASMRWIILRMVSGSTRLNDDAIIMMMVVIIDNHTVDTTLMVAADCNLDRGSDWGRSQCAKLVYVPYNPKV